MQNKNSRTKKDRILVTWHGAKNKKKDCLQVWPVRTAERHTEASGGRPQIQRDQPRRRAAAVLPLAGHRLRKHQHNHSNKPWAPVAEPGLNRTPGRVLSIDVHKITVQKIHENINGKIDNIQKAPSRSNIFIIQQLIQVLLQQLIQVQR